MLICFLLLFYNHEQYPPYDFDDENKENFNVDFYKVPVHTTKIKESQFRNTRLSKIDFSAACNLTEIQSRAFMNCQNLQSIDLIFCENLESIHSCAFMDCNSLSSIKFPTKSLKSISYGAFANTNLSLVILPSSVTELTVTAANPGIFENCTNLNTVMFSSECKLERLSGFVFKGSGIRYMTLGSDLKELDGRAFFNCQRLNKINIPKDCMRYIQVNEHIIYTRDFLTLVMVSPAFHGTLVLHDSTRKVGSCACAYSHVQDIIVSPKLQSIDMLAFKCTPLTSFSFPNSLFTIGQSAFEGCTLLKEVEIPPLVITISPMCFKGCTGLKKIVFGSGLKNIENDAFAYCTNLTEIPKLESVKIIHNNAFSYTGITELVVTKALSKIEFNPFTYSNLSKITLEKDVVTYSMYNGSLYSSDFRQLELVPTRMTGVLELHPLTERLMPRCAQSSQISSIVFNKELSNIGAGSFAYCDKLQSVSIPESIKLLNRYSFAWCTSLKSIVFPSEHCRITIPYACFLGCSSLLELRIPKNVVMIMDEAFENCSSLTNLIIENPEIRFYPNPFVGCNRLSCVVWHNVSQASISRSGLNPILLKDKCKDPSVEKPTGSHLYTDNDKDDQTKVVITTPSILDPDLDRSKEPIVPDVPEEHKFNDVDAKRNEEAYEKNGVVTVSARLIAASSETVQKYKNTIKKLQFESKPDIVFIEDEFLTDCQSIEEVDLSECKCLVSIGSDAFCNCTKLSKLKLPMDGVLTSILDGAFQRTAITSIVIPMSVSELPDKGISWGAFSNTRLKSIEFASGSQILSMTSHIFCNTLITKFEIPENLRELKGCVFEGCYNLAEITVHPKNKVFKLLDNGIYQVDTTTSFIVIPKTLTGQISIKKGTTTIHISAFSNSKISSVKIPNSVSFIDGWAFMHCVNLISIEIPSSVSRIGQHCFFGCKALEKADIGNSVYQIQESLFLDCHSLKSFHISDQVKRIQDNAFLNCYSLCELTGAMFVQGIGQRAFENTNITEFYISNVMLKVNNYAFAHCPQLQQISVDMRNPIFNEYEHCLYSNKMSNLISVSGKYDRSIQIPDTVISISPGAFAGSRVRSVTLPKAIGEIPNDAFNGCPNLEIIEIQKWVVKIGEAALANCPKLRLVKYDGVMNSIASNSFENSTMIIKKPSTNNDILS